MVGVVKFLCSQADNEKKIMIIKKSNLIMVYLTYFTNRIGILRILFIRIFQVEISTYIIYKYSQR